MEQYGSSRVTGFSGWTSNAGRARRAGSYERGSIVVLCAIVLPLFLILSVIVVDVGNWYVHKKRLQTLVDAGAFAGATKFVGCSAEFGDPVAANAAIKAIALNYSGDTARDPTTRNLQEQQPGDVRVVLNSAEYWANDDPQTGIGLDDTLDTDGDGAGDPCSERALDVKATDDDAPLLFGFLPFVADPKSKARVEIRQIKEQSGMLPWAVPDLEPAAVAAIFVDENTGEVFDHQLLMQQDVVSLPFSEWTTPALEEPVDLASENTSVVILVSKVDDTPSLSTGGAGTLTDICAQSPGLVTCYAGAGNQSGLTFIHGWSDIPGELEPAAPQIRDVSLFPITCEGDFSAPYFLRSAEDCSLGATAVIDFGFDPDPTPSPPTGIGAVVKLKGPGCGNNGCTMEYSGEAFAANESIWTTTQNATLDPDPKDAGRQTFSISWETEFPAGTTNSGTFLGVAHPYVADESSGPVDYLKVDTSDPGVPDPNSRNTGPPRSVIITVGLRKPLALEDPLATPILLRVASPSGSQNQALDCDKTETFRSEIENGCQTTYALNYDDWSTPKDGVKEWADILCDRYDVGDLPPNSIVNDPTPICVAVETGDKIGPFRQGLSKRYETPTCWPNNWPDEEDEVDDFFAPGGYDFANDPRYVTLIVTDYGTFQQSGNDQVPVKYFAGFYVTGWDVNGPVKPCLRNDPHPWYGSTYRKSLDDGDVWGHFVNIVVFSASGLPSDQLCNFDEIGNCIAVLVE